MPSTDASAQTGTGPVPRTDEESEDTLDLQLSEDLLSLLRAGDLAQAPWPATPGSAAGDLLDSPGAWKPVATPAGVFQLVPVDIERDLSLLSHWMNDPAVAAFWELSGPESVTRAHLRPQLDGDGRSVPCLGVLQGTPMSYWEIYRADLDPLARHYPAHPHDTGLHLLIGGVADRGAAPAPPCCVPSPTSYWTTDPTAPVSSLSRTCATPPRSRPFSVRDSATRPKSTSPTNARR